MKKQLLFIFGLIIIGVILVFGLKLTPVNRKVSFSPANISEYLDSGITCSLDYMNSYTNASMAGIENHVSVSNSEKQDTPSLFSFKNISNPDDGVVNILSSHNGMVEDLTALKVVDTSDVVQLIGFANTTKDATVMYTIYKKSGFFTYSRSGPLLILETANLGFGKCNL